MIRRIALILAVSLAAVGAPPAALAQPARTLDAFVTEANRIPLNATAMLRPSARRLADEANESFRVIGGEIRAARAAGRTPAACPPDKISLNPRQLLTFLNAIPQPRRARMSVTDGFRAWMADRYPCRG